MSNPDSHAWSPELARLVAAVLRRPPAAELDAATILAHVGFDSIMFAELAAELEARYRLVIPLPDLFGVSLGELSRLLETNATREQTAPVAPSARTVNARRRELSVELVAATAPPRLAPKTLQFSLFFFGEAGEHADAYQQIFDCARVGDELSFDAVWLPERHFHPFGGISPNPSVLAAALSQVTKRLRLRAGSVILPLHDPVRVAEEWAVVDNLSRGRVDLAFGWGWNPNDFVLAPERFDERRSITLAGIQAVERLWRGGKAQADNGQRAAVSFHVYPRPIQSSLPVWLTCTRNPEAFITAGALGYNVLTALLFQDVEELATKIALYRAARAQNGHDPETGIVSLMLHTLLGEDREEVRERVRAPFSRYLSSSRTLWQQAAANLGELDDTQRDVTLRHAFERYFDTAALFGTPHSVGPLLTQLSASGVDEIACLVDFGLETSRVLESLHLVHELQEQMRTPEKASLRACR